MSPHFKCGQLFNPNLFQLTPLPFQTPPPPPPSPFQPSLRLYGRTWRTSTDMVPAIAVLTSTAHALFLLLFGVLWFAGVPPADASSGGFLGCPNALHYDMFMVRIAGLLRADARSRARPDIRGDARRAPRGLQEEARHAPRLRPHRALGPSIFAHALRHRRRRRGEARTLLV